MKKSVEKCEKVQRCIGKQRYEKSAEKGGKVQKSKEKCGKVKRSVEKCETVQRCMGKQRYEKLQKSVGKCRKC